MEDSRFDVLGLAPADLGHPGLALAVARNGGIGLLDLEFARSEVQVRRNFRRLLDAADGRVGLRCVPEQALLVRELVESAGARSLTVILAAPASELAALRQAAGVRAYDVCLAELLAAEDLGIAEQCCDGTVARGHESGGRGSEDSTFILLQKLHGRTHKPPRKPIYAQGGIGVHAAAACRVAGAAGVVLDDALLLLAESPLPPAVQDELARLNGAECRPYGDPMHGGLRLYARPGSAALKTAEDAARQFESGAIPRADFERRVRACTGWADGDRLSPLGQGIGSAAAYRERYGTVAALLQAVRRASLRQPEQAIHLGVLGEHSALAAAHSTRYPLAQGPMTRVSDDPRFAFEVAAAGALPFLALALLRGPQVAELLAQTRSLMGERSWGVGLLGFVSQELRDEQCAEIWKCPPPFALIAGGRPDQAAEFERRGITTYLHAPAPALLKMYLQQGARRFVFEGRECGGHIGPLSSFALWEQCIDVLLADVPGGEEKNVHVLFAGGVHDALSGAMLAAMTAPLAARGMKVGALMGTAYLFTQEIVASGAVVEGFQEEALRCRRTVNLESGPGHATRCVDTPFAAQFAEARRRLSRDGLSTEAMRAALEDLNLGRLRIASKGRTRDAAGAMIAVPRDEQTRDGLYMIGQVATLRDGVLPVRQLHDDVCNGAQALLAARQPVDAQSEKPADIAIVGIGLALPGANDAADYWQMILERRSVLREVPAERWDAEQFFDADPKARDKVYSKWGGFLDEIPFDPVRFGIPPKAMKSIDPMQLLALECAARTLADAGYADGGFDRERTSVILGASGGAGDLGVQYAMRAELPRFVEDLSPEVWERLPEWTEESFAGTLLNVAAGRIANRLDLGGVNFTVDAACGSSLAAIKLALDELETGRSAMVLAGGFDTTQSIFAFTAFSKTQALSARGQPKTFDQSTDGIAISEGVAMVALKRLADAQAAGDRIYAVIKSAAGSSDGRALGLTAPRTEGQVRALRRAYAKAGFSPATLGLVEAHGTGTIVGDRTEAQTVAQTLADAQAAPQSVALGSVKTLLGHTKAAAGISGLVKVALSLHHRVLPGHLGVELPIEPLADTRAPVYLLKDARPWFAHPQHPRRGAVSAFGFGGTNFHAVLEEHTASAAGADGARRWPTELFVFRAPDAATLATEIEQLGTHLRPGSRLDAGALAALLARNAQQRGGQPVALAIVAPDLAALAEDIAATLAHLRQGKSLPPGVRYSAQPPAQAPGLAFVFPGQGAQYVNMGREAALYVDELRQAVELADRVLGADFGGTSLSRLIYPPAAFDAATEAAQAAALTDTRAAQPAIGTLALGFLRLAERLGVSAQAATGHSYGEYAALLAAGAIEPDDFLRLSAVRGRAMAAAAASSAPGGMAAVHGARARVQALLADFPDLRIANHNTPEQCVISGPRAALDRALPRIEADGLRCTRLPVSGAFHTELVAPARAPLSQAIRATRFTPPRLPVYANSNAAPYPDEPAAMQALLDEHLLSSVEFVAGIEAMYAAGCRVFLELGPKSIVSGMVRQTLAGRDATAIALDGGGLRGLLGGLAELFVAGVDLDLTQLFAPRELPALTPARLAELGQPLELPRHTWMLSGGCARPIGDPVRRTGAKPALTQATAAAARAQRAAAAAPATA
ncbi:MAG: beta-ketoacyl synthase N-terminal-like domain-containing protein, partial [Sinimarinibacterium sp.]